MAEAGKAAPLAEKTDEEKEQESVNMQGDMKTFRAKHYFRLVVATAGFVVTAWLLGRLGCGLFWMVPFLVFIFSWWNRTSSEILETTVRLAEMESHRMKAFKNAETAEWLNFIVNRWCVFNPFKMLFLWLWKNALLSTLLLVDVLVVMVMVLVVVMMVMIMAMMMMVMTMFGDDHDHDGVDDGDVAVAAGGGGVVVVVVALVIFLLLFFLIRCFLGVSLVTAQY